MRGHYESELHGLCVHPTKKEFVTVGGDNLLVIWDGAHRKEKYTIGLDYPAKVVEMSPNGKYLAIGCKNGYSLIYNYKTASQMHYIKGRQ